MVFEKLSEVIGHNRFVVDIRIETGWARTRAQYIPDGQSGVPGCAATGDIAGIVLVQQVQNDWPEAVTCVCVVLSGPQGFRSRHASQDQCMGVRPADWGESPNRGRAGVISNLAGSIHTRYPVA